MHTTVVSLGHAKNLRAEISYLHMYLQEQLIIQ